jgi:hypothetical protein
MESRLTIFLVALPFVLWLGWFMYLLARMWFADMLWLDLFLTCGLAAYLLASDYHWSVRATAAAIGFLVPMATALGAETLYRRWVPFPPPCRRGKCKRIEDYKLIDLPGEAGKFADQCRCGDMYVYSDVHWGRYSRVAILLPDGSTEPYLIRRRFGRWRPDQSTP